MKVSQLKKGMLVRPKSGFAWRHQKSAYLEKVMCLTVMPVPDSEFEDVVVMYVGERDVEDMSYGKQIVLWEGKKLSVNPTAWRSVIPVK